jgi:hypothetical protein
MFFKSVDMCLVCRRSLHHRGTEAQRKVLLHLNPPRLCASVVRKLFTNWRQSRGRGLFAKLADALPKVPSERCVLGLAIEAVHFARIFPEVVELEFLRRPPRATPAFSLQHQGKFRNLIVGRPAALLLRCASLPSSVARENQVYFSDLSQVGVAPTFRACPERSEGSASADLKVSATGKGNSRTQHQCPASGVR